MINPDAHARCPVAPHSRRISVACRPQLRAQPSQGGLNPMYCFGFQKRSTGRSGATACALLALALLAPATEAQGPARGVTGLWIDHTGQGAVEIGPCGERVCGRVVWLENPTHKSKSGKPICGTQILGDLQPRQNQHVGVRLDLQSRGRGALQRRDQAEEREHAARHRLPRHQDPRRDLHLEARHERSRPLRAASRRSDAASCRCADRTGITPPLRPRPGRRPASAFALAARLASSQLTNRSVRSATTWRC